IVAIGETGLDFWYKHVRRDEDKKREQRVVFERHLDLAKRHDLPIVIHSRGAWRECLEMTVASGVKKADFHWYSGPLDILKGILDAGFVISVTPALAYSEELKAAARLAPLEQILVETDTPVRGWTPKDVQTTVTLLAEVKGLPREEVARVVNATARGFFIIRDCP
ncbi:MAG: TatD family hydrolase, partial [Elusimicrobia bacterium]|nr:TatD family hydrolase [Elusimicrobiota bacterium]